MRRGDDPNRRREADGRYAIELRCDCCGKPIHGEYATDAEVVGGGDGPGFYLCGRKSCGKLQEGKSIEERRALYRARVTWR